MAFPTQCFVGSAVEEQVYGSDLEGFKTERVEATESQALIPAFTASTQPCSGAAARSSNKGRAKTPFPVYYEPKTRFHRRIPYMMGSTGNPNRAFGFLPLAKMRPQSSLKWFGQIGSYVGGPWEKQGKEKIWLGPNEGGETSSTNHRQIITRPATGEAIVEEATSVPYHLCAPNVTNYGKRKGTRGLRPSSKVLWTRVSLIAYSLGVGTQET